MTLKFLTEKKGYFEPNTRAKKVLNIPYYWYIDKEDAADVYDKLWDKKFEHLFKDVVMWRVTHEGSIPITKTEIDNYGYD